MHLTIGISPTERDYLSMAPFCAPELFGLNLAPIMAKYQHLLTPVAFKKNQPILQTGDYVDHLYYLRTGFAWDTQLSKNGFEKNMLFFPQSLLGLHSIAYRQPIIYSIKALVPITAYRFSYETFRHLLGQEALFAEAVLKLSNLAMHAMGTASMQSLNASAGEKVCQLLYCHHLCEAYYPALQKIYFSQQKVAGLAGVHRVSANNIIKDLKNRGILANIDGQHKIMDLAKLKALAYDH